MVRGYAGNISLFFSFNLEIALNLVIYDIDYFFEYKFVLNIQMWLSFFFMYQIVVKSNATKALRALDRYK